MTPVSWANLSVEVRPQVAHFNLGFSTILINKCSTCVEAILTKLQTSPIFDTTFQSFSFQTIGLGEGHRRAGTLGKPLNEIPR